MKINKETILKLNPLFQAIARGLDCRFMVKDSMYKQAEIFEGAYRDLCIAKLDEIREIYATKSKE